MSDKVQVQVGGHELTLSNLDKVFYPKAGFTKGQCIAYYVRMADIVLPHVRNRPMVMARYPNGVEGSMFYQKRCPDHKPKWVQTTYMWSESTQRKLNFCILDDVGSLAWLINLAAIELHPFLATVDDLYTPTLMTFDLDPGPGADLVDCSRVALQLRELLSQMNLQGFPKSSGKKGMHLNVPLNTPTTYEESKGFARALAMLLEKHHPDRITSNMRKDLRKRKVFVDWSQNDQHKSTVAVYSLRVTGTPRVSMPVTWEEVEQAAERGDYSGLLFEADAALARVEKLGDLHAPMLTLKQKLPALVAP